MNSRFAASLPARQVYLKIKPIPRRIRDTKEILKALQQYGEVMTYRNLRYEKYVYAPNIVLAIFQTPKAAENLINASPLQVTVNSPLSSEASPSDRTTTSPQAPQEPTIWTRYSVTVTPSYDNHAKRAEKNPYSGHWQPQHTVSYEDLVKDVPLKEYGDCSTTRYDLDAKTLHALRKEADAQEGLMDMWRRGLQNKEGMKP